MNEYPVVRLYPFLSSGKSGNYLKLTTPWKGEIVQHKISVNIPFPGVIILYHQPNRNFNAPFKISPYKAVCQSSLISPPTQKKNMFMIPPFFSHPFWPKSSYFWMVGFRGSRHLWFQHVSTNQKESKKQICPNIFCQKKICWFASSCTKFQLKKAFPKPWRKKSLLSHPHCLHMANPLCHLPCSDVPPAPRRAALAQQVQMARNPLAALLAWRRGTKHLDVPGT